MNTRGDDDNTFVWFKKLYQRTLKETDSEYIDWFYKFERAQKEIMKNTLPRVDLNIYRHSLGVTDKDVLRHLILWRKIIKNIFYCNRKNLSEKARNLVQIM